MALYPGGEGSSWACPDLGGVMVMLMVMAMVVMMVMVMVMGSPSGKV